MRKARMSNGGEAIAVLDVGTTKVCCLIARQGEDAKPRVVGIGHQLSRGLRGGAIVDMEQAEASILAAVHAAEQMAGETRRTRIGVLFATA